MTAVKNQVPDITGQSWCPLRSNFSRISELHARAQIGPVISELTGQPADFQLLRGAARVGRLILTMQGPGMIKVFSGE